MKFCINCGTQLDDDAKFCYSCGTATNPTAAQPVVAPAAEQAATQPAAQPAPKKKGKEKLLGMRDKTVKFEKKHSLIVNLLVLCCSFVILMVSLFAPIKVSGYLGTAGVGSGLMYGEADGGGAQYGYVEVNQTIYDMIGAVFYTFPGGLSKETINAEVSQELAAAESEYRLWRSSHPFATELEGIQARAEIYGDHLSSTNYLGYILANSAPYEETEKTITGDDYDYDYDYDYDTDETESSSGIYMGTFISAVFSVTLGLAIAIISIVMAILSLINLIKAIVGLSKKKTIVSYDKYMLRMFALSGASLVLMWVSPLLATGGGMFGISVFIAITLLVTGVLRSLFVRGDNWLGVIKRGVTALLCMLAFYLLCCNTFIFKTYNQNATNSLHVKPGYAFYCLYSLANGSSIGSLYASTYAAGLVMFLLTAGFIMSFAYKVYNRAIHNVVNGDKNSKPIHGIMIAVAVLTAVGLVYGLLSGQIIKILGKKIGKGGLSAKWLMSGHVWASLVMTILAIVLHYAFKPENICKGKSMVVMPALEVEPAPAAVAAEGAPAETPVEEENHDAISAAEPPEQTAAEEPVTEDPVTEDQAPPQEDNA